MIIEAGLTSKRIEKYFAEGKRFDGRALDEFRDIEIECGLSKKAEGSAKVKIGGTEVWVGVKIEATTPYPDSPDKGNLMVTAELTPMSHSKYELGPPKFNAIELGRLVDRGIRESKIIDLEKLCIKKGEKVWGVIIDVYSVNDDGNLLDAAFIGALAALRSAKLPFYDEELGKIDYDKPAKDALPLTKNNPINFCVYKIGESIFLDPTFEEEVASDGRLVIGAISGKELKICSMQKSGDTAISEEMFGKMLDLAEKKDKTFFGEIQKKIDSAIKALNK
ncbi:MAG: exosome complex protein Rrp42 [Nanoarchaeota archaeon]|nr:exosome complex protein Rrp42 [Nanoarchaeota archaeon]